MLLNKRSDDKVFLARAQIEDKASYLQLLKARRCAPPPHKKNMKSWTFSKRIVGANQKEGLDLTWRASWPSSAENVFQACEAIIYGDTYDNVLKTALASAPAFGGPASKVSS